MLPLTHLLNPSLKNWLNIYERIEYSKGVIIFKSVNVLCPSYISELFTFQNSNIYSLRSASNSNMCLPIPNREIFKRTFQFSGVQIWNKLPTAVRSANTISTFKKSTRQTYKVKTHQKFVVLIHVYTFVYIDYFLFYYYIHDCVILYILYILLLLLLWGPQGGIAYS